jgi:hypothetical protein
VPANYAALKEMADVENLLDYFAAEIFLGNRDWPGNNIRYWRPREDGGKWRILFFDLDQGFRLDNLFHDTIAYATNDQPSGLEHQHNDPEDTFLLRALLRSPEFRDEFIRRFDDLANVVFSPARVIDMIVQFQLRIWPEMPAQVERWWSTLDPPRTMDTWYYFVSSMGTFGAWRPTLMTMFVAQHFGLVGRNPLAVNVAGSGGVRVNSQMALGYPYAGTHFSQVPVRLSAVPDEGYRFERWSGSVESTDATIMLDMSAARNVIAHFVPDTE